MRAVSLIVVSWACVEGACGPPTSADTLPRDTQFELGGAFSLSPEGELRLALATPCTMEVSPHVNAPASYTRVKVRVRCSHSRLDRIQVIAHTPWDQDIRGTWIDTGHLAFRADWKAIGVDPLAVDAPAVVARPWVISGTQWTPSSAEVAAVLKLIGDATDTQTELVRGGPPAELEVTTFAVEGDALRAGYPGTLVVRIANHGSGAAYRVVATTRSSIEALHGLRLSFGLIKPGMEKVRKLQLAVPSSETAHNAMLVLELSEGNGIAPRHVSYRIPIAARAPMLSVQCTVAGRKVTRPDLDAGQRLSLRCAVDNTGDAEAKQVELEASVAGGTPRRSAPRAIAASGHLIFDVSIVVPRTLPIDAPVEIAIVARDRPSSRTAQTTIVGVVRKPKLCVRGQLTREQYRAKIDELRAEVAAGDITQAELDRYDAELVACLK